MFWFSYSLFRSLSLRLHAFLFSNYRGTAQTHTKGEERTNSIRSFVRRDLRIRRTKQFWISHSRRFTCTLNRCDSDKVHTLTALQCITIEKRNETQQQTESCQMVKAKQKLIVVIGSESNVQHRRRQQKQCSAATFDDGTVRVRECVCVWLWVYWIVLALTKEVFPSFRFIWIAFHSLARVQLNSTEKTNTQYANALLSSSSSSPASAAAASASFHSIQNWKLHKLQSVAWGISDDRSCMNRRPANKRQITHLSGYTRMKYAHKDSPVLSKIETIHDRRRRRLEHNDDQRRCKKSDCYQNNVVVEILEMQLYTKKNLFLLLALEIVHRISFVTQTLVVCLVIVSMIVHWTRVLFFFFFLFVFNCCAFTRVSFSSLAFSSEND